MAFIFILLSQWDRPPGPSALAEAFLDDGECTVGDAVSGERAARNPGDAAGVVGGAQRSTRDAADVIDQDIVIFGSALGVADDALEDFEHLRSA